MSPIDLKGQCGPLDLRFPKISFERNRKRQKVSKSLYCFLGEEEEPKERAKEGKRKGVCMS